MTGRMAPAKTPAAVLSANPSKPRGDFRSRADSS